MSNDPAVIDEMLTTAKTIAVVGMSDKTWRASYNIGRYLAGVGYRVFPVNPAISEVLGLKSYPDLESAQFAAREQTGDGIDLVSTVQIAVKHRFWLICSAPVHGSTPAVPAIPWKAPPAGSGKKPAETF